MHNSQIVVNGLDGLSKVYKGKDKCEDQEFQNRNGLDTWKWAQTVHIFVSYANIHKTVFTEETPISDTKQKNQKTSVLADTRTCTISLYKF